MKKIFEHPVTGQRVIVTHDEGKSFVLVSTQHRNQSIKFDIELNCHCCAANLFKIFNKSAAKIAVNDPGGLYDWIDINMPRGQH